MFSDVCGLIASPSLPPQSIPTDTFSSVSRLTLAVSYPPPARSGESRVRPRGQRAADADAAAAVVMACPPVCNLKLWTGDESVRVCQEKETNGSAVRRRAAFTVFSNIDGRKHCSRLHHARAPSTDVSRGGIESSEIPVKKILNADGVLCTKEIDYSTR